MHLARTAAVLALAVAPALAQQDASARLRGVPGPFRSRSYVYTDQGLVRAAPAPPGIVIGSVYVNDCGVGTTYAALAPGERFFDTGEAPGSDNDQLLCGGDVAYDHWAIDGFTFGYCSDQASVDFEIAFYDLHPSCTDPTGLVPAASFVLTGLPGTATGAVTCWTINVTLPFAQEFMLQADGNGTWDADPSLDTFGASFAIANLTGSDTAGILVAGDPVHLGQGCEFGVGTIFEGPDTTGSDPHGTGYGSVDAFGLVSGAAFVGCFDFGGWPQEPWASFLLLLDSPYDCTPWNFLPLVCGFGTGNGPPCPCGNQGGFQAGCLHSGGVGAEIESAPGTGASVSQADLQLLATELPVGNGGIFLCGTAVHSGVAVFDGVTCVGGSTLRLGAGFETGPGVRFSGDDAGLGPSLITEGNAASPGYFVPGMDYSFCYWFRDVATGSSPCGTLANFTPTGFVYLVP